MEMLELEEELEGGLRVKGIVAQGGRYRDDTGARGFSPCQPWDHGAVRHRAGAAR